MEKTAPERAAKEIEEDLVWMEYQDCRVLKEILDQLEPMDYLEKMGYPENQDAMERMDQLEKRVLLVSQELTEQRVNADWVELKVQKVIPDCPVP